MQYGDQRTIDTAHSLALRHVIAAVRCLAFPIPETDLATNHLDRAVEQVVVAEEAAEHTNDEPTGKATSKG